jgi:hypothetical protein
VNVDLGFEVEACNDFVELRKHMWGYHDVHSLLNSTWAHPETQLSTEDDVSIIYDVGPGVHTNIPYYLTYFIIATCF